MHKRHALLCAENVRGRHGDVVQPDEGRRVLLYRCGCGLRGRGRVVAARVAHKPIGDQRSDDETTKKCAS